MIFEAYTGDTVKGTNTGFTAKAWIALPEWITTDSVLTASPANMGDELIVTTAPVFATGKGALPIELFRDSVEVPGKAGGDMGSKTLVFSPKIFVKGDSPASLSLVKYFLNRPVVVWLRKAGEGCAGQIHQYGSVCDPAEMEDATPNTGKLREGKSGYELVLDATTKYFFADGVTLTEYP